MARLRACSLMEHADRLECLDNLSRAGDGAREDSGGMQLAASHREAQQLTSDGGRHSNARTIIAAA
jgi:hypothetical protein